MESELVVVFTFSGAVFFCEKTPTQWGHYLYLRPNGDIIFSGSINYEVVVH